MRYWPACRDREETRRVPATRLRVVRRQKNADSRRRAPDSGIPEKAAQGEGARRGSSPERSLKLAREKRGL